METKQRLDLPDQFTAGAGGIERLIEEPPEGASHGEHPLAVLAPSSAWDNAILLHVTPPFPVLGRSRNSVQSVPAATMDSLLTVSAFINTSAPRPKKIDRRFRHRYKLSARICCVRFIITMVTMTKAEQALKLVKTMGLVRPKDLLPFGIAPIHLRRLVQSGELVQAARGVYKLPTHKGTQYHHLAEAAKRFPGGLVCLLSALHFHGLLKRPPEVWLAIGQKARRPTAEELPVRFVRFSKQSMESGTETHQIEGVQVRITNCCRSVTDAIRYRNKLPKNLALDALRACMRQRRCQKGELLKCAKAGRVASVIRPYLEVLA